jgi:hypothetical protein
VVKTFVAEPNRNPPVLTYRCRRGDIRQPFGHDRLAAVVVDTGEIARHVARTAIRRRLLRDVRGDRLQHLVT